MNDGLKRDFKCMGNITRGNDMLNVIAFCVMYGLPWICRIF